MTDIKKILVIRFRRVGDAILTTALCSSLRLTFPNAEIHYVLNDGIDSLFLDHPEITKIITFTQKENSNYLDFTKKIKKLMKEEKYDILIDTRSTAKTLLFALFSLKTKFRIGTKKIYNIFLHNYRIENRNNKKTDVISHLLMLLDPLKKIADVNYEHNFTLHITPEEKNEFYRYMIKQGIDPKKPKIMVAASTRLNNKMWRLERIKKILELIIEKYDAQIILNVTGYETKIAKKLHQDMNLNSRVFTTIDAKSLRELAMLTINCDFFFGNEGGPRHISQALSIPSYAIFPPGISKKMWLPNMGDRYSGISPDDIIPSTQQKTLSYQERFDLIEIDLVWSGLEKMLDKYLPRHN